MSDVTPAFRFYPKDFLTDGHVAAMSLAERGAYITLLCLCWQERSLPADPKRLAQMVGASPRDFNRLWPALRACFQEADGRLTQRRLERERTKQDDYRRLKRDAGQAGAAARWQTDGSANGTPMAEAMAKPSQTLCQIDGTSIAEGIAKHSFSFPSPVSSSVSFVPKDTQSAPTRAPHPSTTPIVKKRRKDAAFESARVWVPQRCHTDFLALRHDNEPELLQFYIEVADVWTNGVHAEHEPGADMFKFWRARYDERWPPTSTIKPQPSVGQVPTYQGWTCPHVDPCAHREMCQHKRVLGADRYPLKPSGASA